MLVLSRHTNEQIMIGDGIIVTVVEIRGGKVRLGIEAPKDVGIRRTETEERKVHVMKKVLLAFLIAACLCYSICGCNHRVVQCDKCGTVGGVVGGTLPGQFSKCNCGGRIHAVRNLSRADWAKAKERGYVTIDDGEPIEQGWKPDYEMTEGRR